MNYSIRDIDLAESGLNKIDWVSKNMPILNEIKERFIKEQPFKGVKVALSIHLEAKTAYLCTVLAAGGADMYITGSNPLSTQDDVAAALVKKGLKVFAWYNATKEEYTGHIKMVLENEPNVIIDDGGDLVHLIHSEYQHILENIYGGCEETTTGIIRLKSMASDNALKMPMISVNDAKCKYLFDNRYGTGQSVWNGINRTTNLIVAGKNVVVAGYGWCGKGVALRAKGLGAHVYVTEIDPVKAIEAVMDGFKVIDMNEAASLGDVFVTVTGCNDVITVDHMKRMKDGAILSNAGHFNVEIAVDELEKAAVEKKEQKKNIMGYRLADNKWVYLLGEGRLVNLACGDGHPAEIMDMSFAIQALSAEYLVKHNQELQNDVISVPEAIDNSVAEMKLKKWDINIDKLTESQDKYLNSWNF